MQENRSFDNLFHGFPGANTANYGLGHGTQYTLQPVPLKYPWDLRHDHPQFLEDYDQGKADGFDDQIGKFKTGSGCAEPINHPSCWVFYKTQKFKTMAFSYVAVRRPAVLDDGVAVRARRQHVFLEQRPEFRVASVLDRRPIGTRVRSSRRATVGLRRDQIGHRRRAQVRGRKAAGLLARRRGTKCPGPFPCFTYPTIAELSTPPA